MATAQQEQNKKKFKRQLKQWTNKLNFPKIDPMPIDFFIKAADIKKKFELCKKSITEEVDNLLNENKHEE